MDTIWGGRNFYSDGTIKVERYTLVKEGFRPIKLRYILGDWEMLAYTNSHLDERWEKINPEIFCEECILKYIEKYGVE
jgi:hypothetical protein